MPKLSFERLVPHRPQQVFDLIADLPSYPRFLPNCTDMVVKKDSGTVKDVRFARMTVSMGPLKQAYTSKVTLDPSALSIRAEAVDGPFAHLDSEWRFRPEGGGTRVNFEIDFKIANRFLAAVAEPVFAGKQEEIIAAFIEEADRRYG